MVAKSVMLLNTRRTCLQQMARWGRETPATTLFKATQKRRATHAQMFKGPVAYDDTEIEENDCLLIA